jgi:hypothetical protein
LQKREFYRERRRQKIQKNIYTIISFLLKNNFMLKHFFIFAFLLITSAVCAQENLDTCRSWQDLEAHRNQTAFVEGRIIEYVPPRDSSKLGDEKIWDWELVLPDNYKHPLTAIDPALDVNSFIGKTVIVKAFIKYGIIFGRENTANIQGYRIDAEMIYLK